MHGKGVEGKIWLTGCLKDGCVVSRRVKVIMTITPAHSVGNVVIRQTSFFIIPKFRPFPVDGLLWLNPGEDDVHVTVEIQVGSDSPKRLLSGKRVHTSSHAYFSLDSQPLTRPRYRSRSAHCVRNQRRQTDKHLEGYVQSVWSWGSLGP